MPTSDFITPAAVGDVHAIYSLLTDAFSDSYLKFSVFQSPRSVTFLREQLDEAECGGTPRFFVARDRGSTLGFYNADRVGDEYFLKYIATTPHRTHEGIGDALLRHFEEMAFSLACSRAGLAVFRSNSVAAPWYERRGYSPVGSELFLRFEAAALERIGSCRVEWEAGAFDAAEKTERQRGFSAFEATSNATPVRVGLIAGDVCNILEPTGEGARPVACAVARAVSGHRKWILMRDKGDSELNALAETIEESIHMTRPLV